MGLLGYGSSAARDVAEFAAASTAAAAKKHDIFMNPTWSEWH
jgi:hypothetical protein